MVYFKMAHNNINRMTADLVHTAKTKMLSEDAILADVRMHRNTLLLVVGSP